MVSPFLLGGSASLFKRGLFRGGKEEKPGEDVRSCALEKYLVLCFCRSSAVRFHRGMGIR